MKLILSVLLASGIVLAAGEANFQKAAEVRAARPHFDWPKSAVNEPALHGRLDELAKRPAPTSDWRSHLFRLLKDKKNPLSAEQRTAFESIRDKFKDEQQRLHDEYNVLRVERLICGWEYTRAEAAELPALKNELAELLALYLRCKADHASACDRQSRELWAILTPEQQREVVEMKWSRYARTEPGHSRAFFTAKILTRALGKIDAAVSQQLAQEAAVWEAKHNAILTRNQAAEELVTRLMFYYDTVDSALFDYGLPRCVKVHGELLDVDSEALRAIYQKLDPAAHSEWNAKIDSAIAELRTMMLDKYSDSASEMLKALGQ